MTDGTLTKLSVKPGDVLVFDNRGGFEYGPIELAHEELDESVQVVA